MVRVSIVPISKGDLRVLATSRPLFDRGPGVVALLGVVTVVSLEAAISSFVTASDLCSDWVRGPEESLVSDLEKDLKTGGNKFVQNLGSKWGSAFGGLPDLLLVSDKVSFDLVEPLVDLAKFGSPVDSPRRSGSRSWLRSGGGGVLSRGVLLGTTLTGVLPTAMSGKEHADAGASALGSRAEVSARLVLVRVRKSANVDGDRDLLRGLTLPRWPTCFIPVGGELVNTPNLTLVVPRDMTESYGGRATAKAWGEGVARHTTLMGVELGSVVLGHLHVGYQIGCRPGPSG
ncbi:hypothetical protein B296_00013902 [Ensete ventricosum]|uniref:Uncharacterized protein n=1 Tax=Ensete ventricosum TaxID=4639 RepID=A0A427B0X7_ENSVE|nr:hypothetical protein B296_00013902 [Ensete ventricosum]